MVGQDIVNVSHCFKEHLHLSGLMVTKYDGEGMREGAVSYRSAT